MNGARARTVDIEPMTPDDWPEVRRIYTEGIATGDATLEREAPDWSHFDRSHPTVCRLIARDGAGGLLGWTALGGYSARTVYRGVAWESVYVGADARRRGVGRALLEALIPASEAAGVWTLMAGVLADNAASLGLHESVGFRRVGVQERMGQDARGRWRDVVLLERRSSVVGRCSRRLNVRRRVDRHSGKPDPSVRPTGDRGGSRPRRAGPSRGS